MLKKKPGRPKKEFATVPEEVPETMSDATASITADEIAPHRTMRYHLTEPPRIFQVGEVIPEEWTKINLSWRQDRDGNWINDNKKEEVK